MLLDSPTIADKSWIYRQYDHMVRTNTIVYPGSDAGVVRIKGTNKALAMSVDCNSLYCFLHPKAGGAIAVCESARNVVCSGAKPMALTDCLNFGNPEKPETMWQFKEAVEGVSLAAEKLGTPVVSGNVSFYNETKGLGIYPTPVIGMVGLNRRRIEGDDAVFQGRRRRYNPSRREQGRDWRYGVPAGSPRPAEGPAAGHRPGRREGASGRRYLRR